MSSIWVQYEFNKKKDETINKEEKYDTKPTVKAYNKSPLIYSSKYSFYENIDIDKFNQCSFLSQKRFISCFIKNLMNLVRQILGKTQKREEQIECASESFRNVKWALTMIFWSIHEFFIW